MHAAEGTCVRISDSGGSGVRSGPERVSPGTAAWSGRGSGPGEPGGRGDGAGTGR